MAVAYFLALAAAAPWTGASRNRRWQAIAIAVSMAGGVWLAAASASATARVWLPHVYLVVGYWLPARLTSAPAAATPLERALRRLDARFAAGFQTMAGWLARLVESAYLLCYPIVPAAFAIVWARGTNEDVNRFWVAVLGSGYVCYGTLPWLISRPPRLVERPAALRSNVRSLNLFVLNWFSHGLNTFPSGHVAVSCAAAGAVTAVDTPAGVILWLIAAAIAAGAVVGRYHYLADVVIGIVVGIVGLTVAAIVAV